jgi:hypothetical protein
VVGIVVRRGEGAGEDDGGVGGAADSELEGGCGSGDEGDFGRGSQVAYLIDFDGERGIGGKARGGAEKQERDAIFQDHRSGV